MQRLSDQLTPLVGRRKMIIRYFLIMLATIAVLRTFLDYRRIGSESMEPTYPVGKSVLFDKVFFRISQIERGDVIEFAINGYPLCKRVIGLPGETIAFKEGEVYVDDVILEEPYLVGDPVTNAGNHETYIIPDGCYFVLGDNREHSFDSRFWDNPYIEMSMIQGKIIQ